MDIYDNLDFLFEADDDNGAGGGDAPAPTTDADGSPQVDTGDTGGDNNTDTNTDNQDQNDDGIEDPAEGQEDDFNIESPDTGGDDNTEGGDDQTQDTGGGGTDTGTGDDEKPEVDADSSKANDKNLYDSLSPAEQEMKTQKLKEQFIELYSTFQTYIDKFNDMSMEFEDIAPQIKHAVDMMFSAKKMISDWLLHIFDSKSYIENDIMYNRYLQVLNSVKNITDDMKKAYKDEIKEG